MAKILVTGSNGFAGRYVTEALVRHGHEVIGLAKNRAIHPNAVLSENHLIDLTDQTALMALVSSVQPDQVVHLAAISFVAHDRAEDIYTNNVIGTRNLLEALAQLDNFHGPLLMVSSANVYGGATAGMVSETALTMPANDYGLSKLAAEHLTRIYHARVPSIVVRPFNYTGVGQPDHPRGSKRPQRFNRFRRGR